MVAPKKKKRATYKDVLAAPEHKVAEIVDGELYLSPRPAARHAISMSTLGALLIPPFGLRNGNGPGGWIIMGEPELHLGKDIVVPDMAGWRRERMASVADVKFFTLAPDWICEGLSPSTEKLDRAGKMRIYAKAGVRHAWLVDARIRTLEVYKLRDDKWSCIDVFTNDQTIRAEPFDSIELKLANLWVELPVRAGERAAKYAAAY